MPTQGTGQGCPRGWTECTPGSQRKPSGCRGAETPAEAEGCMQGPCSICSNRSGGNICGLALATPRRYLWSELLSRVFPEPASITRGPGRPQPEMMLKGKQSLGERWWSFRVYPEDSGEQLMGKLRLHVIWWALSSNRPNCGIVKKKNPRDDQYSSKWRGASEEEEGDQARAWHVWRLCLSITIESHTWETREHTQPPRGPGFRGGEHLEMVHGQSHFLATYSLSWDTKIWRVRLDLPVSSGESFIHSFACSFIQ